MPMTVQRMTRYLVGEKEKRYLIDCILLQIITEAILVLRYRTSRKETITISNSDMEITSMVSNSQNENSKKLIEII